MNSQELSTQLNILRENPPWRASLSDPSLTMGNITDGFGSPGPGDYDRWQASIKALEEEISALQEINRP